MSLVLPAISLTPDPEWVSGIPFLRRLAGGIVGAGVVIAVVMLGWAAFRVVGAKLAWTSQVDAVEPVRVVVFAVVLVILSGLLAFSFDIVSFPDFSSGSSGVAPPWKPPNDDSCTNFSCVLLPNGP